MQKRAPFSIEGGRERTAHSRRRFTLPFRRSLSLPLSRARAGRTETTRAWGVRQNTHRPHLSARDGGKERAGRERCPRREHAPDLLSVFLPPPNPPSLPQVTRDTFPTLLPRLRSALASADYVALDLEYTGIEAGGDAPCPIDDAEDRYARIAPAATRFAPLQVGLCAATWTGAGYECATFNCPVWPGAVGGRQEMAVSAAALTFLTAAGFDTTATIREGVPYAPLAWRDASLARAASDRARRAAPAGGGDNGGAPAGRAPIIPTRPDDVALVARVQQDVAAWLAACGGAHTPPPLTLPCGNAFQRALVYQTLRDGHGPDPPFVAATGGPDPPLGVRRPRNAPIVVSRAPPGGAAAADAARAAESDAAIAAAAGFSVVMEALRDARVPVVVHNGSGDVLHLLSAFVGGGLPAEWGAFKQLVAHWFPGGLYDTKAMCGPPDTSPWGRATSLREVYDGVVATGAVVAAGDGGSGRRSRAPPGPRVPPPTHAPGCDRYAAAAADPAAADATEHEAGFDAFLTAAAFWGLATREAAAAAAGGGNGAPPPQTSPPTPRSPRDMVAALAFPPPPPPHRLGGGGGGWRGGGMLCSSTPRTCPSLPPAPAPTPAPPARAIMWYTWCRCRRPWTAERWRVLPPRARACGGAACCRGWGVPPPRSRCGTRWTRRGSPGRRARAVRRGLPRAGGARRSCRRRPLPPRPSRRRWLRRPS